ncbi:hypothetical protein GCK32_021561 [Trichostrongylus colubriformis]|uniref:Uncharacterized protein n=1 Tax=Trichostrongylus colubriformis TaxID=6319 RepID=A0AAN8ID87_TRICO
MTVSTFAHTSVHPTSNVITTAMATNLVGHTTAVKSTHLGSPAKISTVPSNKGTAVTEPTQNTTEGGFLLEATDAQNFGYENTKNKKTYVLPFP